MKKINFLFLVGLLLLCNFSFGQDTLKFHARHMISFGCQFSPNREKYGDGYSYKVTYQQPGYELLYKYLIPNKRTCFSTAISAGAFYRQGQFNYSFVHSSGFEFISSNFKKTDGLLGITQYYSTSGAKKVRLLLGIGWNLGYCFYNPGKADGTRGGVFYGGSSGNYADDTKDYFRSFYTSLQAELSLGFRLRPNQFIMIGGRQALEKCDLIGIKANFTATAFIAFSFR